MAITTTIVIATTLALRGGIGASVVTQVDAPVEHQSAIGLGVTVLPADRFTDRPDTAGVRAAK